MSGPGAGRREIHHRKEKSTGAEKPAEGKSVKWENERGTAGKNNGAEIVTSSSKVTLDTKNWKAQNIYAGECSIKEFTARSAYEHHNRGMLQYSGAGGERNSRGGKAAAPKSQSI